MNNIAKTEINSCTIQKKKKQEIINKVLCYQLKKDKAMIYVNTFEQMLQDFKFFESKFFELKFFEPKIFEPKFFKPKVFMNVFFVHLFFVFKVVFCQAAK